MIDRLEENKRRVLAFHLQTVPGQAATGNTMF